ncbi:DUF1566 domain-containing protein, partial [Candidatus Marithioploca araucensis]|nr:DUF1566 domain-containing protein [Candidatus Marithioploca araucensis]
ILRQMEEANNGVNIVILDACRDNPFTTSQKGVGKGLAKMDSPTGSLIAFATAPNTSAWGGESGERNSIYTKYFLKALQNQAHLSITDLFIQIRKEVIQETQNETKQVPWESVSLTNRFCFGTCGSGEQGEFERQRAELERQRSQFFREKTRQKEEARLKAKQEHLGSQRKEAERRELAQKLRECESHFQANRLTTGQGGTALACYQVVLKKDPNNAQALTGLNNIEARYVTWIKRSLDKGQQDKAKQYLASLRRVNPQSSQLAALEARLSTLSSPKYSSYRYTDNGDGTVTDNRSGLIWLKNANCFGEQMWKKAMQSAANLASGQCGLRDGSRRGMWRLPTIKEWKAMIDKKYGSWEKPGLAISNAAGTGKWEEGDAFSGVQTNFYWSSTPYADNTGYAWYVGGVPSGVPSGVKALTYYIWAVRGGV